MSSTPTAWKATRVSEVSTALAVAACAAGVALSAPVAAEAKANCDKRRGATLASTQVLRLYGVWETASRRDPSRGMFVCTYKDGRRYRLATTVRRGGPTQFGVNGNVLFFVESARSDTASQDAGIVYVTTRVWDARTREFVGVVPSRSVAYSDLAISPAGVVAAIAEPRGRQPLGSDGQPVAPRSEVVVYDPAGYKPDRGVNDPPFYPPWRTLATGQPGAFTKLGSSSDTLYWQSGMTVLTAPFRAP